MRILLIITILFLSVKVLACDGCNISTGFINVDPVNYVSFRHRNIRYKGEEIPFFRHTGNGGELEENFLNYEFVTKYFVGSHLFLQSFFSVKQTLIFSQETERNLIGIADPIFLIGYQNFEIYQKMQFNYSFFGGCDLGIGQYNTSLTEEYSPGSNTTDLLVGSELFARFSNWAIISKSNYKIGFQNPQGYRFGQTLNTSLFFGYYYGQANLVGLPLIGFSYESDFMDYNNNNLVNFSSSDVFFADIGLNFMNNKKFILGAKYKIPLFKDVPGWSSLKLRSFELEISMVLGD